MMQTFNSILDILILGLKPIVSYSNIGLNEETRAINIPSDGLIYFASTFANVVVMDSDGNTLSTLRTNVNIPLFIDQTQGTLTAKPAAIKLVSISATNSVCCQSFNLSHIKEAVK